MNIRRIATSLTVAGAALALIGVGVGASFTDSAIATTNINVGTFGINISSATTGAVVSNSNHTVKLTCDTIQSSIAGSCPLAFTITNTGSMPAVVTVASSWVTSYPFWDMFSYTNPGSKTIPAGGHFDYSGGIQWGTLGNPNLSESLSVTYTASASA